MDEKMMDLLREVIVLWSNYIQNKEKLSEEEASTVSAFLIKITPFVETANSNTG